MRRTVYMNSEEYKKLFDTIAEWEHENKHNKTSKPKEMESKIKRLIQNSVKLEEKTCL